MQLLWITDIHHPAISGEHYRRSGAAFAEFNKICSGLDSKPDLILASGDLVNRGSARLDDLETLRSALEEIDVPYMVCPGNHDLAPSERFAEMYPGMEDLEPCPLEETNYGRVFGSEGLMGTLPIPNTPWRIVSFALRDGDPDGQLEWLSSALAVPGPVLVVGHYPVLQSRSGGFCARWGYARIGSVREPLREILEHRDATTVYCCGHQHINSVVRSGGLTQIVTGALGNSPYCFRSIALDASGLELETSFLPGFDDWLDDAMGSGDSVDAEHSTPELYHRGNDDERRRRINT